MMNDQPFEHAPQAPTRPPVERQTPARSRHRILWWGIALIVLLAAGATAWHHRSSTGTAPSATQASQGQAEPVAVATAAPGDVRVIFNGIGTVTPLVTVSVMTQIDGQLQEVAFTEGQIVHKGDLLAQIDPRPYQALLDQYEGQLAHDEALHKQAQADSVRYHVELKQDSIARQTAQDQDFLIQQYQGSVRADQAQIDGQELNISYCRIVSPIDGRVGLRSVDPGNYVQTTNTTAIAVVTQIQPISVIFALPEDDLPQVLKPVHRGVKLTATAYDRANTTRLATGELATMDNEVDPTTGTWKLRALFANPDEMLFPDQFVNVHLLVDTLHHVLTVPEAAIQRGAPGTFVYLIKADDTVTVRKVKLGVEDAGVVQVVSGLTTGDKVVVEGADALSDGARISIQGGGAALAKAS
jgi:multidrug efflux system membrane fusion protein